MNNILAEEISLLIDTAISCFEKGDFEEAIENFQRILIVFDEKEFIKNSLGNKSNQTFYYAAISHKLLGHHDIAKNIG